MRWLRDSGCTCTCPFCAVRCGYCDFNTYTATELGGGGSQAAYAGHAVAEVRYAGQVLGEDRPPVETVFFGGGTPDAAARRRPRLDPARDRGHLRARRRRRGDDRGQPRQCHAAEPGRPARGRRSPHQLRHAVGGAARAARAGAHPRPAIGCRRPCSWAREAGLRAGQPRPDLRHARGSRSEDWRTSLEAALACAPDHVSAYSLIVEEGTRLARQVRTGAVACARRRRPGRQVRPGRRGAERRRPGVVRGVELGPRPGRAVPAQRAVLDERRAGGASARVPTPTSAAAGGGTSSTPARTPPGSWPGSRRPRTARPSTWRPGRWSGCCWRSG